MVITCGNPVLCRCCLVRRMLLKESELELEKKSVRNLNPIPYVVWLAGNINEINSRICLICKSTSELDHIVSFPKLLIKMKKMCLKPSIGDYEMVLGNLGRLDTR
uniref:Uncharacterized protein n=1 Tax=Lactuca sativa TaxID=4236 RepID=A0A9R1XV71_LACSA|nr:hypothetical protein LSAT_V11C200061650 [Lactuca sativa]